MNTCDFEYDGYCLRDYGYIICAFDASSGAVTKTGGEISFNQVQMNHGKKYAFTDASYSNCIEATFQICKDPELFEDEMEITPEEFRALSRWLMRPSYHRMRFIYEDEDFVCYFNASFNVNKITVGDTLYGAELQMKTDSPFGYGELYTQSASVDADGTFIVIDQNDEIGDMYPSVEIVCDESGDMELTNITTGDITVINNVEAGETITIDGEHKIVLSDIQGHKTYNDFNFEFPRLVNTIVERDNEFTASLPCTVTVSYYPIIKDIPS